MPPLSPREQQILDAVSTGFERSWVIAARAGLTGAKATYTATTFLTALVGRGMIEKGGSRLDPTWRLKLKAAN